MKVNNIILVEDDEQGGVLTRDFLMSVGFNVDYFTNAVDAIAHLHNKKYDVLLLDISLPDYDGFEILKSIKNKVAIEVIILSAHSDTKYKIQAFKLGAIDYMTKPIDLEELEARVWLAINRNSIIKTKQDTFEIVDDTIRFLDESLSLTQIENEILKVLINNKNQTMHRDILASQLSEISSSRSLDYHIKNIRKKINDNGKTNKYLKTIYGVGYTITF